MNRLFETHHIRRQVSLDGIWDFRAEGVDKLYKMPVPGCWEQHPDFFQYRGAGTYTRQVRVAKDGNIRLEFKGVSHTADVYFDDEKIAHHYNAYTPFSVVVRDVAAGEHTLSIRVDSSYSEYSSLHIPNDYYSFGGISRPVSMEYVPDVYIKYVHFTPRLDDGIWNGTTEICVVNLSGSEKSVMLRSELAGVSRSRTVTAPAGETVVAFEADYLDVQPWELEDPKLYYIQVQAEADGMQDDLIDRIGFRYVSYDSRKFYLNGKPVFLKGLNRHEDYGLVGSAVPLQMMSHDLDLFEDMSANAVRTSHYPNDERFLDMCDERGFLVWEENHARGLTLEQMQNPNFERQCADCIDEMIENHYNHPSIVIWAILNECASDTQEGRAMYKKQLDQIRALDQTRPMTFASCKYYGDVSLDLPDMVSFNCYFPMGKVKEEAQRLFRWIDTEAGGGDKALIVSEFGCEALYGYREPSGPAWSEEKQVRFLTENINTYMDDPRVTGLFIWMFADARISTERLGDWRPRGRNNKGVVDEYRRPKLSYHAVKELFRRDPYGERKQQG